MPLVPSLTTALTTGYQAYYSDVYGFKSYPIIVDNLEGVEVAIFNKDVNSHPFHMHGNNFFVCVRGSLDQDPTKRLISTEYPIRRDTITVPPKEYAVIRFRGDNPGIWLFHCHMEFHVEQGLALTFVVAPYMLIANTTLPEQYKRNCDLMGIPNSGNAMGRVGLDMADEPRGPFPLSGF
ncbi:ferroxidase fet3 [Coemansia biformis]|uniref:Ferroxidase fet3 n=1 Tax=Coemansia biformis TaxID=1286918 RepID=A0A9W7YBJ0_9FUNG|nr:ferroxidase fet3 [Coemansia biformis]